MVEQRLQTFQHILNHLNLVMFSVKEYHFLIIFMNIVGYLSGEGASIPNIFFFN